MSDAKVWRVVDICSGRPCIAGTRVMVETVAGRFSAGDSIAALAADYDVPAEAIEAAIRAVVAGAFTKFGLAAHITKAMEQRIPLTEVKR